MKVTICMNSGECEVMDFEDTICIAGEDVELGYLKINPERIPAIVAANIAEEEIKRMAEHRMHLDVCGNYMVITDDRAVVCTEDEVAVWKGEIIFTLSFLLARSQSLPLPICSTKER